MRNIRFIKVDKEGWLKTLVPETIRLLSSKYHFYWSKFYHNIHSDIHAFLAKKKDSYNHKMVLYQDENNKFFFVVYCKTKIDVYYLDENYIKSYSQVKYFINKWERYYENEEECFEEEKYSLF